MTKVENKKMKTKKILFIFAATPSLSGRGVVAIPPTPQYFSRQKFLKNFFIDTWVSRQRVGKLTLWQS